MRRIAGNPAVAAARVGKNPTPRVVGDDAVIIGAGAFISGAGGGTSGRGGSGGRGSAGLGALLGKNAGPICDSTTVAMTGVAIGAGVGIGMGAGIGTGVGIGADMTTVALGIIFAGVEIIFLPPRRENTKAAQQIIKPKSPSV